MTGGTLDLTRVQRRTVGVLAGGQVLGGVAFGATLSLGALLAVRVAGDEAFAGFATAAVTLGSALCAIPLARLAARRGRRLALTLANLAAIVGIIIVVTSAAIVSFAMLMVGIILIGMGNAGNLQSRFAATDLASPTRRGRDLGTVVWATTIGAVAGPLLVTPGEAVGALFGMPVYTGAYLFSVVAQSLAFVLYIVALRPDPLLTAQEQERANPQPVTPGGEDRPATARFAIFAVSSSHVVMAAVMAMTPLHLEHLAMGGAAGHAGHAGHGAMSGDDSSVTLLVGITMAIHLLGMFGLSPVMGMLADRWGRTRMILVGQGIFTASLVLTAIATESVPGVMVAQFLLGLGWSAATIAGAALLTEATPLAQRPRRQGIGDTMMTAFAAIGSILAGLILGWIGYGPLALVALVLVAAVVVAAVLVLRSESRRLTDA